MTDHRGTSSVADPLNLSTTSMRYALKATTVNKLSLYIYIHCFFEVFMLVFSHCMASREVADIAEGRKSRGRKQVYNTELESSSF